MKFKDLGSGSGGKNYLRLKAGESVRGVFRGDIVDFRQHWSNNRGVVCPGREKCELCKQGEKSAFRFRINVIFNENGSYVAKVWEQGKAIYEQLRALHADFDLEKNLVKITRFGSGTDTTYSVVPVPKGELTKDQLKAVGEVKINVLEENSSDATTEAEETEDEEIPF